MLALAEDAAEVDLLSTSWRVGDDVDIDIDSVDLEVSSTMEPTPLPFDAVTTSFVFAAVVTVELLYPSFVCGSSDDEGEDDESPSAPVSAAAAVLSLMDMISVSVDLCVDLS